MSTFPTSTSSGPSARRTRSALSITTAVLALLITLAAVMPVHAATDTGTKGTLQAALQELVTRSDGPPGIIVVVRRGATQTVYRAGTSHVGQSAPIQTTEHIRVASVAKAYSGATALSLVGDHLLSLGDTVGKWLPTLPGDWHRVTLAELLQHTSGIPDFSSNPEFGKAVGQNPDTPPSPEALLSYAKPGLIFTPGTEYRYSNSDNIIVGLMVQAASGQSYESELQSRILGPLELSGTSLPSGPAIAPPFVSGYDLNPPNAPNDVTNLFAAGWSWASGGVVATPQDLSSFMRAYVSGVETSKAAHKAQFTFRPGKSEPPGPGTNSAGLAVFRYKTSCGTVYGHTGNTPGYTNFAAASADGTRSVTVQINAQITPKVNEAAWPALDRIYELGVCTALGR